MPLSARFRRWVRCLTVPQGRHIGTSIYCGEELWGRGPNLIIPWWSMCFLPQKLARRYSAVARFAATSCTAPHNCVWAFEIQIQDAKTQGEPLTPQE